MALSDKDFEPLQISLKGTYPFRTATTSFIYPEDYGENVKMLAPFFDEIELVFFESEAPPDKSEIKKLLQLKEEFGITYNIHLPQDISIASSDPSIRRKATDSIKEIYVLSGCLAPTAYTLHIPIEKGMTSESDVKKWQERAISEIGSLISSGIPARDISVENLMYPFEWFLPVVTRHDLSVTMDVGHLIVEKRKISEMVDAFKDRLTMIHLHGVDRTGNSPKDHVPICHLNQEEVAIIRDVLQFYKETVSLEVFSLKNLQASLEVFETTF